jgi:hypothetical protein
MTAYKTSRPGQQSAWAEAVKTWLRAHRRQRGGVRFAGGGVRMSPRVARAFFAGAAAAGLVPAAGGDCFSAVGR